MDQAATSALYPKRRTRIQTQTPIRADMRKRPKRKIQRGTNPGRKKLKPKAKALNIESSKKTTNDRTTPISQDPEIRWKGPMGQ